MVRVPDLESVKCDTRPAGLRQRACWCGGAARAAGSCFSHFDRVFDAELPSQDRRVVF